MDSEDDEEFLPGKMLATSSSDDSDKKIKPKEKKRGQGNAVEEDSEETDCKDSDRPEWTTHRQDNLRSWLEGIDAARGNLIAKPSSLYWPDHKSKQYTMSYFLDPLCKQYPGYRELSVDKKKEFREKVLDGGGDIGGVRVAETVQLYMKQIMGLVQDREFKLGRGDQLPLGRLQFWQFFDFKVPTTSTCWRRRILSRPPWTRWPPTASRSTASPVTTGL